MQLCTDDTDDVVTISGLIEMVPAVVGYVGQAGVHIYHLEDDKLNSKSGCTNCSYRGINVVSLSAIYVCYCKYVITIFDGRHGCLCNCFC